MFCAETRWDGVASGDCRRETDQLAPNSGLPSRSGNRNVDVGREGKPVGLFPDSNRPGSQRSARPPRSIQTGMDIRCYVGAILLLPVLALAGNLYIEQGAWFASLPDPVGTECTLNSGGYDRVSEVQHPMLTVTLRQDANNATRIELDANAVTGFSAADLPRLRALLRVEGPKPLGVAAVPSALTQTAYDRRLTLRPHFAGAREQRQMLGLIDAMRAGDRLVVEINGRELEPAFSLRGFDALWQQAMRRCGPGAE